MNPDSAPKTPAPWRSGDDGPMLTLGACARCGHRFFPPHGYGCERCGADELRTEAVKGIGRIEALVDVDRPDGSFRVADVRLDGSEVIVQARVAPGTEGHDLVTARLDEEGHGPVVVFTRLEGDL